MAQVLTCPKCKNRFHVPEDHAGAKIPCPRCEHLIAVGSGQAGPEDVMAGKPGARRSARPPEEDLIVPEVDEDAPPVRRKGFKPCPRCGAEGARRVLWTSWGSFYGPALFNHVRCRECRYAYNGRTGGSNLIPAIVFMAVPLLIIAGLLGFIGWVLYKAMF